MLLAGIQSVFIREKWKAKNQPESIEKQNQLEYLEKLSRKLYTIILIVLITYLAMLLYSR